jgi:hypothetical protein
MKEAPDSILSYVLPEMQREDDGTKKGLSQKAEMDLPPVRIDPFSGDQKR